MPTFTVNLQDEVAIVTGGGDDVGRAVALALAASGAAVTVNDLNPDRAEAVATQIKDAGGRALAFSGDISNRYQVSAMIEATRDALGEVSVLVNTAGSFKADTFDKIDEWDWRKQIDVMLTGALFTNQLISRVMTDRGGGVIVNLASNITTAESGIGYVSAKTGLLGLTRQAARELAPQNIRVNAVCAGNLDHYSSPPVTANMLDRPGTVEEIADVVLFLCSDAARFITGQTITADGGGLS